MLVCGLMRTGGPHQEDRGDGDGEGAVPVGDGEEDGGLEEEVILRRPILERSPALMSPGDLGSGRDLRVVLRLATWPEIVGIGRRNATTAEVVGSGEVAVAATATAAVGDQDHDHQAPAHNTRVLALVQQVDAKKAAHQLSSIQHLFVHCQRW